MIIKIKNKKSGYYKLACIASIYHTKLPIPKTIQETLSFIPIQKPVNIKHSDNQPDCVFWTGL